MLHHEIELIDKIKQFILLKKDTSDDSNDSVSYKPKPIFFLLLDLTKLFSKYDSFSDAFIHHSDLNFLLNEVAVSDQNDEEDMIFCRLFHTIELFLRTSNQDADEKFNRIEPAIKRCLSAVSQEKKTRGMAEPPLFFDAAFLKRIFLLGNERLSKLFLQYIPLPPLDLFAGSAIPMIITQKHQHLASKTHEFLQGHEKSLFDIKKTVITLQRRFRARKRANEDVARLAWRYNIEVEEAKSFLAEANQPYIPQCKEVLSKRLVKASQTVKLFSTIRHLTSLEHIKNILDDAIYGRQTLLNKLIPFNKMALNYTDIEEGDFNMICMGADKIHICKKPTLEILFDADKIAQNNPCCFYKQRDFGYDDKINREISIGELKILFSHTHERAFAKTRIFIMKADAERPIISRDIKTSLFVSNNLLKMHQILTLNFFRFIDALDQTNEQEQELQSQIYQALDKLDDESLKITLEQIGKAITDTMEFNFYGAHKIDFSTVISLRNLENNFTLNLPDLLKQLNQGDISAYNEAQEKIPELFTSHQFVEYLVSNIKNLEIIDHLLKPKQQNLASKNGFKS